MQFAKITPRRRNARDFEETLGAVHYCSDEREEVTVRTQITLTKYLMKLCENCSRGTSETPPPLLELSKA
jgi:hypothetical protein